MAYVHHRIVRFQDCDPAGIVYFARAFEFAHQAFEDCLAAGGMPLADAIANADWAMPLVHAEADYRAPMRFGDALRVLVRVDGHSEGSLQFGFEILGVEDDRVRARVQHVHAAVDRATFRRRPLPDAILEVLRRAGALESA